MPHRPGLDIDEAQTRDLELVLREAQVELAATVLLDALQRRIVLVDGLALEVVQVPVPLEVDLSEPMLADAELCEEPPTARRTPTAVATEAISPSMRNLSKTTEPGASQVWAQTARFQLPALAKRRSPTDPMELASTFPEDRQPSSQLLSAPSARREGLYTNPLYASDVRASGAPPS